MEPSPKKAKSDSSWGENLLIRLSDAFVRTDGNAICPIIKAENSIRVLHKLQKQLFHEILREAGCGIGLKRITIHWKSLTGHRMINGNIFIKCEVSRKFTDETKKKFSEELTAVFRRKSKVKHILVDIVRDMDVIPQPIISEIDFDLYKLELCYKELTDSTEEEKDVFKITTKSIKNTIEELKEQYTKIAVLSQNGKGKSFFLNLLLLITSDNEEEYAENNKSLKLPQDISGRPTFKELMEMKETFLHLPEVVREFVRKQSNLKEDFKTALKPIFHDLNIGNTRKDLQKSNKSFKSLSRYFTQGSRLSIEPYLLAQKGLEKSYESTTKCIIHLRYGTVYQLKVEYFEAEELQEQLFELVSLLKKDAVTCGINKAVKNKSCECLKTRFGLLTDYAASDINEDFLCQFKTYEDIALSEAVTTFVGLTELYVGKGTELAVDRLSMQAVLRHLTSGQDDNSSENLAWKHRVAAVKEIILYIPSKILYGGKEILEMPGTDDSDPLAMDFIQTALNTVDAIFIMSDFAFKIAEREVKEILLKSDFVQAWKKDPEHYSLMFLAYPEKDTNFQFGEDSKDAIQTLYASEVKKRSKEIEELCKLLDMDKDKLSAPMDKSIFTSYVLPVLHTSILMQEGTPHTVIAENADFLKYTGIDNMINHLDNLIAAKQSEYILKIEQNLKKLNRKPEMVSNTKGVESALNLLKRKELKDLVEGTCCLAYDLMLAELQRQLKTLYKNTLATTVDSLLVSSVQDAKARWEEKENRITSQGQFNPYFCGNHPAYQVRIAQVLFLDSEDHKNKIFTFLAAEIKRLLLQYKMFSCS
uniref:Uncharacterized protein n=1 Tax=Leptobrachium leishanense TaxID=445787 RepID=A0A8C5LHV3_9ANUR